VKKSLHAFVYMLAVVSICGMSGFRKSVAALLQDKKLQKQNRGVGGGHDLNREHSTREQ